MPHHTCVCCTHICTYTHIHRYTYTLIYIDIHIHMYTCVCICIFTYIWHLPAEAEQSQRPYCPKTHMQSIQYSFCIVHLYSFAEAVFGEYLVGLEPTRWTMSRFSARLTSCGSMQQGCVGFGNTRSSLLYAATMFSLKLILMRRLAWFCR